MKELENEKINCINSLKNWERTYEDLLKHGIGKMFVKEDAAMILGKLNLYEKEIMRIDHEIFMHKEKKYDVRYKQNIDLVEEYRDKIQIPKTFEEFHAQKNHETSCQSS